MLLKSRTALLFLLPASALYAVFIVWPTLRGLALSFTNAHGVVGGDFVGFANYTHLFSDPAVLAALRNTVAYAVVITVVQNGLGLALAYWMQSSPRVRAIARAGLLLPSMMAFIAVGFVWNYIYSPLGGPLNSILDALGLHSLQRVWLGDPATALLAICVTNIWMFVGYSATIYLSGYLTIPPSIMEAASLDGARGWVRFRTIDWPLLAPAFTINLTLTTIGSLRIFDPVLVMTRGGPGTATQSLSYLVYSTSTSSFDFGYATAIAALLLAITVIVAVVQTAILRRREIEW